MNNDKNRNEEYMTELDRIMMRQRAKEELEIEYGLRKRRDITGMATALESMKDIQEREKQREEDGLPRKVKYRRILVGPGKVITVPYVEEEHLTHGESEPKSIIDEYGSNFAIGRSDDDIITSPGSGEGEEGEVIGERPLPLGGEGEEGQEAGEDEGEHDIEEEAYEIGQRISEQLELPNLSEKRKKFPTNEYTYDLTDRHRGSGQFLDKKESLKRITKTNILLGRTDRDNPNPKDMIVVPQDKVYRVLSRERVWKSQAVVCFLRDYSISMYGEPTEALVSQHLLIYSWLLTQYEKRVIPRFFVHDVNCREVTARQYFRLSAGGGTFIPSGYQKINEVVESEGLQDEYDIFVFQGSDGDDGDWRGDVAIPELEKILSYANRMGVTLFKHPYRLETGTETTFEGYINESGIPERKDVFRMHIMPSTDVTEEMNIEALKALIAQD
ncbi:MAG: DUF444 family protein [Candidatus Spechtbacterales bacterium]|nr:DUF444 family protein [Candidatus Spechtbacterales bacterium]